jgi:hypothetical protein
MSLYLVTYKPLCGTADGREAIRRYGHAPFVDASCRREPDLEAEPASISALCRAWAFAPRLREGDVAVYLTKLGKYPGMSTAAWRLVAVLQVMKRCESHEEAADWYARRNLPLPSDCLVVGNDPLPLDHTSEWNRELRDWDVGYQARVDKYPTFLICKKLYVELSQPKTVTRADLEEVFGRIPATRTPAVQNPNEVRKLLAGLGIGVSIEDSGGLAASLAGYPITAGPREPSARAARERTRSPPGCVPPLAPRKPPQGGC